MQRIEIPPSISDEPLPPELHCWITAAYQRITTFQDRWDRIQIEQFVASDYELVYQMLRWIDRTQLAEGRRFIEWGCGFAVVSCLASSLGWDVVGIEAEEVLLHEGRKTVADSRQPVELIRGNFLPPGAEAMSDDPTLPSLGHSVESAYDILGMDLDDFAICFAYPWPGEEDFITDVFERYAARDALLALFCGPYDVRLYRK